MLIRVNFALVQVAHQQIIPITSEFFPAKVALVPTVPCEEHTIFLNIHLSPNPHLIWLISHVLLKSATSSYL
jgi:hypothetical protein